MAQSIDAKVLTFDELVQIPNRVAFLDAVKVKACRTRLAERKPIEFLPVHIYESYLPEKNGQLTLDRFAFRMYKIIMFGIVKSGEKVTVVLDNVMPFMEIRVPRKVDTEEFKKSVLMMCQEQGFKVKESHIIKGATIKEYEDYADFIQICFSSLAERKKTLEFFDKKKYRGADGSDTSYETTHDDATCYYRMVSRDTLTPWTNWCTATDYQVTRKHQFFNSLYTLHVDYRKVQAYQGDIFADPDLRQDKTVELNWDVETRDPVVTEEIPHPSSSTFDMPNISMSFVHPHGALCPVNACGPNDPKYDWTRPPGHLVQYNITTMMTPPMPGRTTIMCKNMSEQIMAFALIWSRMQPEYEVTFNGHNYDWLCFTEVARQLNLLEFLERNMSMVDLALYRQIEDRAFQNPKKPFQVTEPEGARQWTGSYTFWKKYQFKISAELQNFPAACLNYPGYVCIDLMPQLRAACNNPEKYSLHKFLEIFQLGDKVEMSYKEMFARMEGNRRLLSTLQLEDLHPESIHAAAREHPGECLYKSYKIGGEVRVEGVTATAYGKTYSLEPEPFRKARVRGSQLEIWCVNMSAAVLEAESDMLEVAEYCIVDGLRCHDLLVKTQYIPDKRLVGVLSYTTMDDCVYRANGMKVRNMIIAKAQSRKYRVSNRAPKKIETGKYPGAYVFPPKKGIATCKPSPSEMRFGALKSDGTRRPVKPKYANWQVMSETDFQRCLIKIEECGVWMEDYLPVCPRVDGVCRVPDDMASLYLERYDQKMPFQEWIDSFPGDLAGEWPAAFIEFLKEDSHYPIAGLDFSSLYPSIIMTYNLSPEMMVHTLERALELMQQGKKIHPVNFPFNGRTIKGWSVRHTYPEKQAEIDTCLKTLRELGTDTGDTLAEEMRIAAELERLLVDTEFGLFPTVLKDLFDQRVGLKAQLKPIATKIEELELLPKDEFATWIRTHADEWSMLMGRFNYLNSKQKALKVFMNTFYGESGNAMSPLRVLALAGGVTSSGQYNIKKVAQLVQDLMCRIYYGDTDSVYLSMPRRSFRQYDKAYYSQRSLWAYVHVHSISKKDKHETEEFWEWLPVASIQPAGKFAGAKHRDIGPLTKKAYFECLVIESFRQIKHVNKAVNDALEADNGTRFLNMAFEEFIFPAAFFSKKKYCGIAHVGGFNHNPKTIFVKGLEYVKKGVSEMLKDISLSILWETFSENNIDRIDEIVERMIEKIYTERNIEFEKFVKTASYRPNKQNVSVHTFHSRMDAIGMAPEPLDRFRYVIVKKYPFKYDLRGRKTPLSVGERMEYADRAQQLGMEIDLDYYMSSNVCGQLARFISWRDDFNVTPRDDSDEAYNEAEKKNIGAASKYIERCYEKWNEKHLSKGPALRTLYKKVNNVFHEEFSAVMRVSDLWQFDNKVDTKSEGDDKNRAQQTYEENQCMFQNIIQKVQQQVNRESKREAERLIATMPLGSTRGDADIKYAVDKRNCYRGLLIQRKALAARRLPMLHEQLRSKVQYLRKLFNKRDNILEQCITGLSSTVGIEGENFDTLEPIIERINGLDTCELRVDINREIVRTVTHQDLMTLGDIDAMYLRLLSIHKLVRITEIVTNDIDNYIHYKLGGVPARGDTDDIDDWIADNIGVDD